MTSVIPRLLVGPLAAFGLIFLGFEAAAAKRKAPKACSSEIGIAAARSLVRDCRDANPAAPALCRPETPCEALREMIADACRVPGAEARPVCRDHLDEDEDDDDDEDE